MTDAEVYAGTALMGAVAGMRSMSAPAIVSHLAKADLLPVGNSPLSFLSCPVTAKTAAIMAAGEIIADKLPFLPSRTKTPSLIWRAVSGGFAGAAICSAKKRPALLGALLGASAAVGASFAFYELRKRAGQSLHVPDPVIAIAEDALVAGGACFAISRLKAEGALA